MIKRFKRKPDQRKFYRVNERIFASTLRVLDSTGSQIGIISKFEALNKAREQGLDLVEVAPLAKPPVAKIVDYKKFLYQEEKKKQEEKRKAKVSETKEVRLGPFTKEHDLLTLIRRTEGFLKDGDKVRLVLKFSGRQMEHPEFGHKIIDRVVKELSNISKVDRDKHFEGRQLISLLSPDRKEKNVKEEDKKISEQKI